jgi:membrane fusion protein (multidrug efflux system)
MRSFPRVTLIVLTAAFALAACSGGADPAANGGGPPGGMAMAVEAVTVRSEPLQAGINTVGTLRADESVVIRPEINGRVVKIHFEEGQRVREGEPLFSLDASVNQADLREAQANLASARRSNDRATDLGGRQLLSKAEVELTQAQLAVTQARVASAQAQLAKTTLVAPFSGVVGLRDVSVGEVVSPGQALVNLVRLDPMEVDFSLPEGQLAQVAPGQTLRLVVDAYPGEEFPGTVSAIEPVIDINSRSARVRAKVDNADNRLRPGLFARVSLDVGDVAATAILVPEQALMQEGETRFVYVVKDGKAVRAEVTTGQRLPGRVAIVEGLSEGDQVITAGQGKPMMHEGAAVNVVPDASGTADTGGGASANDTPANAG